MTRELHTLAHRIADRWGGPGCDRLVGHPSEQGGLGFQFTDRYGSVYRGAFPGGTIVLFNDRGEPIRTRRVEPGEVLVRCATYDPASCWVLDATVTHPKIIDIETYTGSWSG